jgi:anterior pharynx defective protein 1
MLDLFFGCLLIAFGPAIVFLLSVVLHHSHLTVLAIVSAFYELMGVLLTSILWYVMPSTFNGRTATALVFGAILQEMMRFLFVVSYGRGETGLVKATGSTQLPFTDFPSALSSGFGFGLMYALLIYGSVLGKSVGEADVFISSCPTTSLFLVEAFCTLAMEVLHVVLMISAFDAWRRDSVKIQRFLRISIVMTLHILASLSTLLNYDASLGGCNIGVPLLYLVVLISIVYTLHVVRGSSYRLRGDFGFIAGQRDSIQQSVGGIHD